LVRSFSNFYFTELLVLVEFGIEEQVLYDSVMSLQHCCSCYYFLSFKGYSRLEYLFLTSYWTI